MNNRTNLIGWAIFDSKPFFMLTNIHVTDQLVSISRRNSNEGRQFPYALHEYNAYHGGTDVADSMRTPYSTWRKSSKWWHCVFYWLLDVMMVNAFIVYHQRMVDKQLTHLEFLMDVVIWLVNPHSDSDNLLVSRSARRSSSQSSSSTPTAPPLRSPVFVAHNERKRCKNCTNKSSTDCSVCLVSYCSMKDRNCFLGHVCFQDVND